MATDMSQIAGNITASNSFEGIISRIAVVPWLSTVVVIITTILLIALASNHFSSKATAQSDTGKARVVPKVNYILPFVGNAFSFLSDPASLMINARNASAHGIFSLQLGPTTHNVVSDPGLVKNVMQQKESIVRFKPIAWTVLTRFFGAPKHMKGKYLEIWDPLHQAVVKTLMQEPHLGNSLQVVIDELQQNIPSMITFTNSVIDQQPWERSSECEVVLTNTPTVEINLFQLMRDMLGWASIPSLFGKAFMEVNPEVLRDVYAMDYGFKWLMSGLPRWFPLPQVIAAHIARKRIKDSMAGFSRAYDAVLDGKPLDPIWGEMDDVSELIKLRTQVYRDGGVAPEDRADASLLWALTVNANVCVYWQILHILAQEDLVGCIRQEIGPYAKVHKPMSINGISEAPRLSISHEGLAKNCPLLKATFYETNRLCNQPWSVRQAEQDVVLARKNTDDDVSYQIRAGEYITVPHELHMLDEHYFEHPLKFMPERFLKTDDDGKVVVDIGTIRPFGGGPSMCKGRVYAERECLSMVAGILAMYDIEPVNEKGWVIPGQRKATAITLPLYDTRVRIRRRHFAWDGTTEEVHVT